MIRTDYEREALEVLRPRYEKQGYEFFVELPLSFLPNHVERYIPDAIAKKDDKFIAIEVKRQRISSIEKQLDKIKSQIEGDKNWRMDYYFSDQIEMEKGPNTQSKQRVMEAIGEAEELLASGKLSSAFLLCWAILEAIARTRFFDAFKRPQSPGRIVTVLAENGTLNPDTANELRSAAEKRNKFIHGELEVKISISEIQKFLTVLRELAKGIRD